MSKFKFVNILDIVFLIIFTFLIVFAWVQFFVKHLVLSLFISLILCGGIVFISRYIKSKKHLKYQLKQKQNEDFIKFKLTIQTMPTQQLISLIKKLIPSSYVPKSIKCDLHFIKNNSKHIFTFCYNEILTENKLLELIKTKKSSNLTVFCASFDKSIKHIASAFKNIKIGIIDLEQLYQIFNYNNILIDNSNIDLTNSKLTIKDILKNSLSRSHAKGYFISGLILLFTSLIVPFKLYYVIFSSTLFVLTILCMFKHKSNHNYSIFEN